VHALALMCPSGIGKQKVDVMFKAMALSRMVPAEDHGEITELFVRQAERAARRERRHIG
jgi:hypothetical protein